MINTKDSILNAAERLFAERGYEATSLRAITAAAGANLAAVNYHFRSKEQLLQALFTRRLEMLNRKRMEMMDVYESEYGKKPVPLEKLVHALIVPMFDTTGDRSKGSRAFSVLLGRMYSSPQSSLDGILLADIKKFAERFETAIRRTLPGIPPEDLYWRVFFAFGATAHALAASHLLQKISRGLCDPEDGEAALERLVAFIVAGLKSPAIAKPPQKQSIRSAKTDKGI
jgi:AcrR family transcriptional regulator